MALTIFTKGLVVSKWENESASANGDKKTYYNIKLVDTATYDNQILSVSKEVYDKCEEQKNIGLYGRVGGLKDKYWYFNEVAEK